MRPKLIDNRSSKEIPLNRFPFSIGRTGCTWNIPTDGIAEKHVVIYDDGEKFFIEDAGSVTGTYLNNRLLERRSQLRDGAILKLAVTEKWPTGVKDLTFKCEEEAKEISAEDLDILQSIKEDALPQKIEARHLIYHITPKGFFSKISKTAKKRVPVEKFGNSSLRFLSMTPFNKGDKLEVEISHPDIDPAVVHLDLIVQQSLAPEKREYFVINSTINKIAPDSYQVIAEHIELDK